MKSRHIPKKHLGQNFLIDPRIQQRIADACGLLPSDIVVEIGPGQGAITRLIAERSKQVISIETDKDLIPLLREEFKDGHVEIVHADFLKWDFKQLSSGIKVIGNIPYNISTPIIERLIEHRGRIKAAYLTVQLEFGQRVAAKSGSKEYGALSCFAQYHADVGILFKIKSSCFRPAPKVDSCFIKLDFARPPAYQPKDEAMLFRVIRTAFSQRRKTLLNTLSSILEKERISAILNDLKIPSNARAEELNIQNFVNISNNLYSGDTRRNPNYSD